MLILDLYGRLEEVFIDIVFIEDDGFWENGGVFWII